MNTRHFLSAMLLILPGLVMASVDDAARLAALLEQGGHELALDARQLAGSSGLAQNSTRLAEKARQLQDTIRRGRSSAYVRMRFSDVSRYFQRVQDTVVRLDGRNGARHVVNDFTRLADVYQRLHFEFYGANQSSATAYTGIGVPAIILLQRHRGADRYIRNPDLGLSVRPPGGRPGHRGDQQRAPVSGRVWGQGLEGRHRSPVQDRLRRNERLSGGHGRAGARGDARLEANHGYERARR